MKKVKQRHVSFCGAEVAQEKVQIFVLCPRPYAFEERIVKRRRKRWNSESNRLDVLLG